MDLGPTWLWPEFQPRLQQLLKALEVDTFHTPVPHPISCLIAWQGEQEN